MKTDEINTAKKTEENYQKIFAEYKSYTGDEPFVFVSYAHDDFEKVRYFFDLMKHNHFRFWFDEGIQTGSEWSDEIARKIKKCAQFLVFISENSVNSDNVKDEIHNAVKHGIDIIRIHLDKTELQEGLELKLDRKQALYVHKYEPNDFKNRFCSALSIKTVESQSDISKAAKRKLEDKYEMFECIGKGGTSKVYRGKSKTTGTKVIIKSANVTNSEIGNNVKEYFNVERNVLSRRISCFSPQVYDYYSNETSIFMVESFIEGATLNEIKDLTVSELVKIIIKTARILNSYHENGLIHCDVKPKHIICQNGECFLIDYGAAKDMSEKTQGYIMGTEGYAAPEQKITYINESDLLKNETLGSGLGGRIDQRTDIFGLGRTLKRMMQIITCGDCELGNMTTGVLFNLEEQNGFEEDTSSNEEALKNDPEKDRFFIADPLLRAIADKMTAERKEDRFQSMLEVEEVLGDYLRLRSKNFDNNN